MICVHIGWRLVINNGFIIQYDADCVLNNTYLDINFPISFQNNTRYVVCTLDKNNAMSTIYNITYFIGFATSYSNKSKMRLVCNKAMAAMMWLAVGY